MDADRIELMIVSYLDGLATEEQIKFVEEWYASFEEKASAYRSIQALDRKMADNYLRLTEALGISESGNEQGTTVNEM